MKYHPHIYNRYNPRQPYYGMPNYNGALSWYSQPFVEGILFSPRWKEEQKEWINGVIYFNKTSVSNELKGWNHWKSGQDFSELFLYIVMSMIFETQSPLSDYNHAYFTNVYVMSRGMTNTTEKIALVEVVIEHLKVIKFFFLILVYGIKCFKKHHDMTLRKQVNIDGQEKHMV